MTFAKRTDANHKDIGQALRKIGWHAFDTSRLPGFVDYVCWRPSLGGGFDIRLVEVKTEKGKLTPVQKANAAKGWPVSVVRSVEDLLSL